MADDLITGMSLRDVRKLLDDKSRGESAFDALDTLLGMLIALAPAALGPAGLALWPLLEPKGELVDGLRKIAGRFTKAKPRDYLDQARNMAAAIALLAWRGGATDLCARSLEEILGACERAEWDVLDVPLELWNGLAMLFGSAGPEFAGYRRRFAVLTEAAIAELQEQAPHSRLPAVMAGFRPLAAILLR